MPTNDTITVTFDDSPETDQFIRDVLGMDSGAAVTDEHRGFLSQAYASGQIPLPGSGTDVPLGPQVLFPGSSGNTPGIGIPLQDIPVNPRTGLPDLDFLNPNFTNQGPQSGGFTGVPGDPQGGNPGGMFSGNSAEFGGIPFFPGGSFNPDDKALQDDAGEHMIASGEFGPQPFRPQGGTWIDPSTPAYQQWLREQQAMFGGGGQQQTNPFGPGGIFGPGKQTGGFFIPDRPRPESFRRSFASTPPQEFASLDPPSTFTKRFEPPPFFPPGGPPNNPPGPPNNPPGPPIDNPSFPGNPGDPPGQNPQPGPGNGNNPGQGENNGFSPSFDPNFNPTFNPNFNPTSVGQGGSAFGQGGNATGGMGGFGQGGAGGRGGSGGQGGFSTSNANQTFTPTINVNTGEPGSEFRFSEFFPDIFSLVQDLPLAEGVTPEMVQQNILSNFFGGNVFSPTGGGAGPGGGGGGGPVRGGGLPGFGGGGGTLPAAETQAFEQLNLPAITDNRGVFRDALGSMVLGDTGAQDLIGGQLTGAIGQANPFEEVEGSVLGEIVRQINQDAERGRENLLNTFGVTNKLDQPIFKEQLQDFEGSVLDALGNARVNFGLERARSSEDVRRGRLNDLLGFNQNAINNLARTLGQEQDLFLTDIGLQDQASNQALQNFLNTVSFNNAVTSSRAGFQDQGIGSALSFLSGAPTGQNAGTGAANIFGNLVTQNNQAAANRQARNNDFNNLLLNPDLWANLPF